MVKWGKNSDIFDDDVVAAHERVQEKSGFWSRLLERTRAGLKKILPPEKKPMTVDEIRELANRTRAKADLEKAKQDLNEQKARGPRTTIKRILSIGTAAGLGLAAFIGARSIHRAGGLSRLQGASDKAVSGAVETVEGVGSAAKSVGTTAKTTGEVVERVSQKVASFTEDPGVLEFVKEAEKRSEKYPELYAQMLWRLGLKDWNSKHPTQPMTLEQLKEIIDAKARLNKEGKTVGAEAMYALAESTCGWKPQGNATPEEAQNAAGTSKKGQPVRKHKGNEY